MPDIGTAKKLESELKMPLVVHIKVATPLAGKQEPARVLTMGDFLKKK
jgi:predicted amidohydrolase